MKSDRERRAGEKFFLRMATEADAAAIRGVYAPYCDQFVTSFELTAPTVAEMQARIQKITAQYPWLVCERDGEVVGYAYACPHRERAAYRWAVDAAVYIAAGHHRAGIGRSLYTALFRILVAQGYFKVYAGITLPNPGSVGLHEAMGFVPIGVYSGVGYKLGAWRDVGWWQLPLRPEVTEPAEPRGIKEVFGSAAGAEALAAGAALLRD